jgi:hypothetical protein
MQNSSVIIRTFAVFTHKQTDSYLSLIKSIQSGHVASEKDPRAPLAARPATNRTHVMFRLSTLLLLLASCCAFHRFDSLLSHLNNVVHVHICCSIRNTPLRMVAVWPKLLRYICKFMQR